MHKSIFYSVKVKQKLWKTVIININAMRCDMLLYNICNEDVRFPRRFRDYISPKNLKCPLKFSEVTSSRGLQSMKFSSL